MKKYKFKIGDRVIWNKRLHPDQVGIITGFRALTLAPVYEVRFKDLPSEIWGENYLTLFFEPNDLLRELLT